MMLAVPGYGLGDGEMDELNSILRSSGDGDSSAGGALAVQAGTSAGLTWLDPNKSNTEKLILTAPQMAAASIGMASQLGSTWATAAIPIVGPIVAGVTIGLTMLLARKGPKQKVATTEIVNKVEPLLARNRDGYLANPTPEGQRQAIENFNAGWNYVVEHCGIPQMGNPGRNCITERDRGGRWDWFALYADPIVNTPPPQRASSNPLASLFGGGSTPGTPGTPGAPGGGSSFLIPAAALAVIAFLIFGGRS